MPRRKQSYPQKHDNCPKTELDDGPSNTPTKPHSPENYNENSCDDEVLDLSIKRPRLTPTSVQRKKSPIVNSSSQNHRSLSISPQNKQSPSPSYFELPKQAIVLESSKTASANCLDQLSQLVSKVGRKVPTSNCMVSPPSVPMSQTILTSSPTIPSAAAAQGLSMQELWWKYMKKEESAELKRMNEAKQIFTCLQCQNSFQSMDQLVKHMGETQHFANVPKHYSWSLQYARQKMRQMKLKLKYSERMMYFCHLCTSPFSTAVHQHFAEVHDMYNPVENMNFVQVIMGSNCGKMTSPRRSESSNSPSTSAGGDSPLASPKSNNEQKPIITTNDSPKASSDYGNSVLLKMEELVKKAVAQPPSATRLKHNSARKA